MKLATSTRCEVLKILVTLHLKKRGGRVGYDASIRREVFINNGCLQLVFKLDKRDWIENGILEY